METSNFSFKLPVKTANATEKNQPTFSTASEGSPQFLFPRLHLPSAWGSTPIGNNSVDTTLSSTPKQNSNNQRTTENDTLYTVQESSQQNIPEQPHYLKFTRPEPVKHLSQIDRPQIQNLGITVPFQFTETFSETYTMVLEKVDDISRYEDDDADGEEELFEQQEESKAENSYFGEIAPQNMPTPDTLQIPSFTESFSEVFVTILEPVEEMETELEIEPLQHTGYNSFEDTTLIFPSEPNSSLQTLDTTETHFPSFTESFSEVFVTVLEPIEEMEKQSEIEEVGLKSIDYNLFEQQTTTVTDPLVVPCEFLHAPQYALPQKQVPDIYHTENANKAELDLPNTDIVVYQEDYVKRFLSAQFAKVYDDSQYLLEWHDTSTNEITVDAKDGENHQLTLADSNEDLRDPIKFSSVNQQKKDNEMEELQSIRNDNDLIEVDSSHVSNTESDSSEPLLENSVLISTPVDGSPEPNNLIPHYLRTSTQNADNMNVIQGENFNLPTDNDTFLPEQSLSPISGDTSANPIGYVQKNQIYKILNEEDIEEIDSSLFKSVKPTNALKRKHSFLYPSFDKLKKKKFCPFCEEELDVDQMEMYYHIKQCVTQFESDNQLLPVAKKRKLQGNLHDIIRQEKENGAKNLEKLREMNTDPQIKLLQIVTDLHHEKKLRVPGMSAAQVKGEIQSLILGNDQRLVWLLQAYGSNKDELAEALCRLAC